VQKHRANGDKKGFWLHRLLPGWSDQPDPFSAGYSRLADLTELEGGAPLPWSSGDVPLSDRTLKAIGLADQHFNR